MAALDIIVYETLSPLAAAFGALRRLPKPDFRLHRPLPLAGNRRTRLLLSRRQRNRRERYFSPVNSSPGAGSFHSGDGEDSGRQLVPRHFSLQKPHAPSPQRECLRLLATS